MTGSRPTSPAFLSATRRGVLGVLGGGFAVLGGGLPSQARADSPARFDWGVASGDPRSDSVVLWTRAVPEDDVRSLTVGFEVAEDEDFARIVRRGAAETSAARDFTVKLDVRGLAAGRTYFYRFHAGGAVSAVGRARTLPAGGDAPVRLALASCANYVSGFYNAYREIADAGELDAVIHVGDYIYEYGQDGYDGATGRELGRLLEPQHEIVTLDDYRARFALYRRDPDLQAAHAAAPFITIWDDHETANNSWVDGAGNHDPETEGRWLARRDAALTAYFEWMPMRDPEAGQAAERLNRVYDFGQVGTVLVIESRLTGRDEQLSYSDMPVRDGEPDVARFEREVLGDPSRSMLGAPQEAWLAAQMRASRERGIAWQILANQTVMAQMRSPDYMRHFPEDVVTATLQAGGYAAAWLERSRLGLPIGLDSWDGYPAARTRLYDAARAADANLVVLSGDSHMFWANELHHPADGERVGIEFGTTGITSPTGYSYINGDKETIYAIAQRALVETNRDIRFTNVRDRGFILITARRDEIEADYVGVSTVRERDYTASRLLTARSRIGTAGLDLETPG